MTYSLEPLQDSCYEDTSVLINKFDIKNQEQLDLVEQGVTTALIAKATVEISFINVNFEFYKMLHKYVFEDIYEWAGKTRKVNMSKKDTIFCEFNRIEELGNQIFDGLARNNYLKNLSGESFLDEFTQLYCSLNYLHPFREGNGRIQRLFLTMLLNDIGLKIDFTKIDKDLFMVATIKAATGDLFLLKNIFREICFGEKQ